MNGPSHYKAAEKLLSDASFTMGLATKRPVSRDGIPLDPVVHAAMIARAQVHATLALAAATALRTEEAYFEIADDVEAWAHATDATILTADEDQGDFDPDEAALGQPIVNVPLPDTASPDGGEVRIWYEGDPEPLDVPELVDREGDLWVNLEPNAWYEKNTGPDRACGWADALEYGPLRRPEQPTAATLLADSREG